MVRRQPVAALLILVLVAGCGGATTSSSPTVSGTPASGTPTANLSSPTTSPSVPPSMIPTPAPTATPTPVPATPSPTIEPSPTPTTAGTMIVRAYLLLDDTRGEDPALVPVLRTVPKSAATARAGIEALLAGPSAKERAAKPPIESFVPAGTKLRGIDVADGLATVDLSGGFATLAPEAAWDLGSFELRARLAQVTYTLTQFTTIERVSFELDGKPVKEFVGLPDPETGATEAIVVDKPVTRATYRDRFLPPIFVDRPAWGAALPDGSHVTGRTSVFEARFRMAVLDHGGKVLVEAPVMASCGSGCWGRFDVTVSYVVPRAQWGTLRVWVISEASGRPAAVREYPVYLRPAS